MVFLHVIAYFVLVCTIAFLLFYVDNLYRRFDERIYLVEKELECIEKWYLGIDDQSEDDQKEDNQSEEDPGDG